MLVNLPAAGGGGELSVEELDHTPVLWEYCPLMMVARDGQQSAFETKAFSKVMPVLCNSALVCGMYWRSSLRMSSVRMNIMLGGAGAD